MESSALQAAESVCVKAEPCEDVCITGTGEPTFEGVSVKAEPLLDEMCIKDEPGRESVSIRAESSCSYVRVKNESHGVSAAAALYADHAVKDELVLGPELVERRGVRRAPTASNLAIKVKQSCGNVAGRTFQMDGCVKLEPLVVDTLLTGTRSTDQDCLRQVQETGIECENKNSAVGNFEIYNRG
ncbi:uncharacterized protein LOC134751557 isoform X2 [Cydia strobilella]|uniref:uncharacterized protein LOC134751557 isoform X2 n=1 Tax=Cydia strobilella TaxID=1100964 RepID=UPI003005AD63